MTTSFQPSSISEINTSSGSGSADVCCSSNSRLTTTSIFIQTEALTVSALTASVKIYVFQSKTFPLEVSYSSFSDDTQEPKLSIENKKCHPEF